MPESLKEFPKIEQCLRIVGISDATVMVRIFVQGHVRTKREDFHVGIKTKQGNLESNLEIWWLEISSEKKKKNDMFRTRIFASPSDRFDCLEKKNHDQGTGKFNWVARKINCQACKRRVCMQSKRVNVKQSFSLHTFACCEEKYEAAVKFNFQSVLQVNSPRNKRPNQFASVKTERSLFGTVQ